MQMSYSSEQSTSGTNGEKDQALGCFVVYCAKYVERRAIAYIFEQTKERC